MQDDVQKQLFCIIKSKEPIIAKKYMQNPSFSPAARMQGNNSVMLPSNSILPSIKKTPKKNRPNSFILPNISPEKKGKKQVIGKLEDHLLKFHHHLLDLLPKENSSFADIQYLGKLNLLLVVLQYNQTVFWEYQFQYQQSFKSKQVKLKLSFLFQQKGFEASPLFLQKRFYSARLDYNIESKNYVRSGGDQVKLFYEEEKVKHKGLEGKIHSIIDLLAYDDIGLRLFYEKGIANLSQLHEKYRRINISFSENDLLCMMRQMITNTCEFISHKWFYNNYQDLQGLVFVKSGGYQEYKIKYAHLLNTSNDSNNYHFENIVFKNTSYPSDTFSSFEPVSTQGLNSQKYNHKEDEVIESQVNLIEEKSENEQAQTIIEPSQIKLYNKDQYQKNQSNNTFRQSQDFKKQKQNDDKQQQKMISSPSKIQNKSDGNLNQQKTSTSSNNLNEQDQDQQVWQKIQVYEIMQICSLVYNIFLEQNFANVDIRIREGSDEDFLREYPKLQGYLMSFIKNSENFEMFQQSIINLKKDKSIPQNILIEDTLLEQIRQEHIINLNQQLIKSNENSSITSTEKSSSYKRKDDIQTTICRDELKSMAMIAVQTINKQLQNELLILQNADKSKKILPETQDFYDSLYNSNLLQIFDKSTLQILSQIVDELLARIDEKQNPFYYAEQVYCKALILFRINTEGVNSIHLLKLCNQIIQRIQGNEINEICGKVYCLMSKIILKTNNNRARALEYAFASYEIRKQVHGQQSRTMEFVDSLKQIAYIYQQKGAYDEAFKYLEKAYVIVDEIKHQFHRSVIQIITDLSLLSFNMQNYTITLKKCMKVIEIYKKCGPNVVSYNFPFIMNLYALVKLKHAQQDVYTKSFDNSMIKDVFKQSLRAAKLIGQSKSDQKSTLHQSIYYNLKQLYQSFLKSIESEEYLMSLQKTPDPKLKNISITKRAEPFSLPINPIIQMGKQFINKGNYPHYQRGSNYGSEYSRSIIDTSLHL